MTESEKQANGNSGTQPEEQSVALHHIYLKDCSFESPLAPGIFTRNTDLKPDIELNLRSETTGLGNDLYEVVLIATVKSHAENEVAFLIEVQQAGIFELRGFGDLDRQPVLGGYCPGLLFPYLRAAVSDLATKGGMPQLVLQPVNFEALFAHSQQTSGDQGTPVTTQG